MLRDLRNTHVALRKLVPMLEEAHITCDIRRALVISAMIEGFNTKLKELKREGYHVCG